MRYAIRSRDTSTSFSEYDTDLATFMQQVVLPDCPPPHFGIAHSAGATVLIRAAHRGLRWFDRMVLSSPMLHLAQSPLLGLAVPVARTLHTLGFGSLTCLAAVLRLGPCDRSLETSSRPTRCVTPVLPR